MTPALQLALYSPLLVVAGYLVALVLHHAGRSTTPGSAIAVAGIGLTVGGGLVAAVGLLANVPGGAGAGAIGAIIPLLVVPAAAIVLARRGARRLAGVLLIATSIPWLTVWGGFLLELFGGREGAGFVIWTGAIAGVVVLALGAALLLFPDPGADPTSPEVQARRRRIGSFGGAILDRARLAPITPSIAATVVTLAITSLIPALRGIPVIVITVVVAAVAAELELRLVPRTALPAVEAFHWIGQAEMQRFKEITGRTVPTTRGAAAAWLATPPSETDLEFRAELLVWLDRRADALAIVAQMPERTPVQRLQKALDADFVAWSADGRERGIDFAALAAEVEGEAERLRADGLVAYRASQHAYAAGDPAWLAPLTAIRARFGPAADGLHPRSMRKLTQTLAIGLGLLLGVVTQSGPLPS